MQHNRVPQPESGKVLKKTRNPARHIYTKRGIHGKNRCKIYPGGTVWQPKLATHPSMPESTAQDANFCAKLKQTRGSMSAEALAERSGMAVSSIYKMEQTARVRWSTVEQAYGVLFEGDDEYYETLMLWALAQSRRQSDPAVSEAAMTRFREESADYGEMQTRRLGEIAGMLGPEDRELLLRHAEKYLKHEPTRLLVRAWLAANG